MLTLPKSRNAAGALHGAARKLGGGGMSVNTNYCTSEYLPAGVADVSIAGKRLAPQGSRQRVRRRGSKIDHGGDGRGTEVTEARFARRPIDQQSRGFSWRAS